MWLGDEKGSVVWIREFEHGLNDFLCTFVAAKHMYVLERTLLLFMELYEFHVWREREFYRIHG